MEVESHIVENKTTLKQMEQRQIDTFGTQANEDIVKAVDILYREYCGSDPTASDPISHCEKLKTAINGRIQEYTATDRSQFHLRKVAETRLEDHAMAVRASGVQLASSMDSLIGERLAVLKSADDFVKRLTETESVECPACGQSIAVDSFRQHIAEESDRLREINDTYTTYRATIGTVCDTLILLKSTLAVTLPPKTVAVAKRVLRVVTYSPKTDPAKMRVLWDDQIVRGEGSSHEEIPV